MASMVNKKFRRAAPHDDGEFLWLVSLSDLMILLFVFFVVLFSFSYKKMSASDLIEAVAVFNGDVDTPIDQIEDDLKASLSEKGLTALVDVHQENGKLIIDIKDAVLFDSGQFHLKNESGTLLNSMSQVFVSIPAQYKIAVEGHSDDAPFASRAGALVSDNWQLSVMRAHEVFRNLALDEELLQRATIVGYGPMKPLVPNRDQGGSPIPENRAKNRRVTITIY